MKGGNRADWISCCAALGLFIASTVAAPGASKLYVTNSRGDDITVIDATALKAVHDIKVGENVHGLCSPAAGDRLFATVESDKSLKVIDTNTDKVLDTIALAGEPNQAPRPERPLCRRPRVLQRHHRNRRPLAKANRRAARTSAPA